MNPTGGPESRRVPVGVLGATGYTGRELLERLGRHDGVRVVFATSRSGAGEPSILPELHLVSPEAAPIGDAEVVFLCLPQGDAAAWVDKTKPASRVVDLTADHRPGSGRENGFVYGLAELHGAQLKGARNVANPGCYPTGVLMALVPLVRAGVMDRERLTVVNAASGVTGAGRTPRTDLLFAEIFGNYRAYGEGNKHRHLKEIHALLPDVPILFQPHLLPVSRGILETITVPVRDGEGAEAVRRFWREAFAGAGAVEILPEGLPDLTRVVETDRLALGAVDVVGVTPRVVTVVAALDNLGKGAAGQAVQNMNLMLGWQLDRGLLC